MVLSLLMNQTSVDVSVVIPVYNASATLLRALKSIQAQTQLPREVICIDDGSCDNSAELAQSFDPAGAFIFRCIVLEHNQGVAAARNHGLDVSTSRYIAFLDADDVWGSDKLALQMQTIVQQGLDLLGGHSGILENLSLQYFSKSTPPLETHSVQLLHAMLSNPWHTSSVVVRRDTCVRFPESGHLSEDFALWLSLVATGWHCASHQQVVSFMFKPAYGASGLSARLWKMQRGELTALSSIGFLYHPFKIAIAIAYSCIKFCWRLLNHYFKRLRAVTR